MLDKPPPHAILLWSDANHIYAELPCTNGTFTRLTFSLCELGLSRALNLLKTHEPPTLRPPLPMKKPTIRSAAFALIAGGRR